MHELVCVGCSRRFKARSPLAKWCDGSGGACQRRHRRAAKAAEVEGAVEGTAEGRPVRSLRDGPLVVAVVAELRAAGALESVDGQLAVVLARQVVVAKGSAVATLGKEMRQVIDRATGAKPRPTEREPAEPAEPVEEEPDELELARRKAAALRDAATG